MAVGTSPPPRAVFLDKDGTLTPDIPYNADPGKVSLYPEVVGGLAKLRQAGFRLIVVSNQSGVARGYFTEAALQQVLRRLRHLLAKEDVLLDAIYYCPHHPEGHVAPYALQCQCRKPLPGLLETAARHNGIHLPESWMIGDILHDVEAGNRAGCHTILLDNGHETEWAQGAMRMPDYIARNLEQAANVILSERRETA